jgi:ABC-type multidrug transport system fused ATPase/permease subunit
MQAKTAPMPVKPAVTEIVSAMNTEYAAIRQEIRTASEHQRTIVQLAVTIFAGVLTLVGVGAQATGSTRNGIGEVLLLVPLAYVVLAITTADAGRRIVMMASYLHYDLRERLEAVLNGAEIWRWEDYVDSYIKKLRRTTKWTVILIDKSRWLIFAFPSVIAIIAAWLILTKLNTIETIIFAMDIALMLAVIVLLGIVDHTAGIKREVSKENST